MALGLQSVIYMLWGDSRGKSGHTKPCIYMYIFQYNRSIYMIHVHVHVPVYVHVYACVYTFTFMYGVYRGVVV